MTDNQKQMSNKACIPGESAVGKALGSIFWGYVLVLIDFHIFGFDILPDFLGYYKIYKAMVILSEKEHAFSRCIALAVPMTVISFINYLNRVYGEFTSNSYNGFFAPQEIPGTVARSGGEIVMDLLSVVPTVLDMLLIGFLFYGLAQMAKGENNTKITEVALRYRKAFLCFCLPFNAAFVLGSDVLRIQSTVFNGLLSWYSMLLISFYLLAILCITNLRYNLKCCQEEI